MDIDSVQVPETPRYKKVIMIDKYGEVVSESTTMASRKNGSGFVISYTAKMCEFLESTTQGSYVRVFIYIAHHQNYGNDGVYGYRCTRIYLAKILGLTRMGLYKALEYLKDKLLINETRKDGQTEFMVNPAYVTIGTNKADRVREWNQRWAQYWVIKANKE